LSVRSHVLSVAAPTWPEIAWPLRRIKTTADVALALRTWHEYRNQHGIVDALLREEKHPSNSQKLRVLEKRRTELNESIKNAEDVQRRCRASFEKVTILRNAIQAAEYDKKANRSPAQDFSEEDQRIVERQLPKRKSALNEAELRLQALRNEDKALSDQIADSLSYIARSELLHFVRKGRYSLNPVNLANALAGWPYLKYRRSIARCRKLEADSTRMRSEFSTTTGTSICEAVSADQGTAYRLVLIIRRMLDCCKKNDLFLGHAEKWLRTTRTRKSDKNSGVMADLRENWFYLQNSIETIVLTKPPTKELPERIAAEYLRRKRNPSSVETLLAEGERITVK
jgi:hypothetical protein